MAIELTDDGTLDTVLRCSDCGEEMRYNYSEGPDDDTGTDDGTGSTAAYDAFVEWAIEDATNDHECPSDPDAEPTEPDEDDLTTSDHKVFYQSGKIAFALIECTDGSLRLAKSGQLLTPNTFPTMEAAIRAYMDRVQFWPNVWFISDHGNAHLMDLSEGK